MGLELLGLLVGGPTPLSASRALTASMHSWQPALTSEICATISSISRIMVSMVLNTLRRKSRWWVTRGACPSIFMVMAMRTAMSKVSFVPASRKRCHPPCTTALAARLQFATASLRLLICDVWLLKRDDQRDDESPSSPPPWRPPPPPSDEGPSNATLCCRGSSGCVVVSSCGEVRGWPAVTDNEEALGAVVVAEEAAVEVWDRAEVAGLSIEGLEAEGGESACFGTNADGAGFDGDPHEEAGLTAAVVDDVLGAMDEEVVAGGLAGAAAAPGLRPAVL